MILIHSREYPNLGKIYADNRFIGYSLDPRVLNSGTYKLEMSYSPKFKRELPLITGATVGPERRILIHPGNTLADTRGCILVGDTVQIDSNGNIKILNSRKTLEKLLKEEQCLHSLTIM
jgi:hypothetical protein